MKGKCVANRRIVGIAIAYFLVYIVWGSTYFFIGMALEDFSPFLLGALRFTVAGAVLLAVCFLRGESVLNRKLIGCSAISGIVLLFIDMAVIMLAQRYVSSSFVAIVASSTALWILLFDVPKWRVNFRNVFTVLGSIIGFAGVAMLYVEQLYVEDSSASNLRGVLLLIFGCISWAIGTLYTKYRSSEVEKENAFAGSAWQMLFAGAMFGLCALVRGDLGNKDWGSIAFMSWLSLIYLIVFGSLLAYSAYVWLLKVRPATEVATHAYVNPFVAVVLGVSFGEESVSLLQLVGLIIILLGVLCVNRK